MEGSLTVSAFRKKLVIVGDSDSGKTSLMWTFATNKFPGENVSTLFDGGYVACIKVDGKAVELAFWDTRGQRNPDYDRFRPLFYPDTDVILMCFSIDSPTSLENIPKKWFPEVSHFCPNVPIILVGNKKDLRDDQETKEKLSKLGKAPVTSEEGRAMCERINGYAYMECSAKTMDGVRDVFETAARAALTYEPPKQRRFLQIKNSRIMSYQLVIVGDSDCGKTFMSSFADNKFPEEYLPLATGGYIACIKVDGKSVHLPFCDTVGQRNPDYDMLRPPSYPHPAVILMCFSIDSPDSLENIPKKWFPEVSHFYVPIILVGIKKDLRDDENVKKELSKLGKALVTSEEGRAMCERINGFAYMECSAKTMDGVREVFVTAARAALAQPEPKPRWLFSGSFLKINDSLIMSANWHEFPLRRKLVVVGDSDCGKTCLMTSFVRNKFPEEYVPREFEVLTVSLENVPEMWVPEMSHFCPNIPIILAGNKKDLRDDQETKEKLSKLGKAPVTSEEGRAMCERINGCAYMECSAKTLDGVRDVFVTAARMKDSTIKSAIPIKLVIVGDSDCGKTCILTSFVRNKFPEEYVPRVFECYAANHEVDGKTVLLGFSDILAEIYIEPKYERLRPLPFVGLTSVILMCFSIDSPDSLENIPKIWFPEVSHYCPNVPIILVGNKKDLRDDQETKEKLSKLGKAPVTSEEGRAMCERINGYAYMECSAKTLDGVRDVFVTAMRAGLTIEPPEQRHGKCSIL
ncbi:hypothetical protein ACROYT_G016856 [Oculina patagonica]